MNLLSISSPKSFEQFPLNFHFYGPSKIEHDFDQNKYFYSLFKFTFLLNLFILIYSNFLLFFSNQCSCIINKKRNT